MTPAKRRKHRQKFIKPLVDAYFNWIRINIDKVMPKSKTYNGMTYSINQEKYLRRFLDDGEVPINNNAAEQSIRSFCIGKKNWVICDTINGAKSSAIIYSLVETAKANKLRLYEYFNYLLTEIPEHMMIRTMISARNFCPGQMNSLQNAGNNTEIKPLRRAANYSGDTHGGAFTISLQYYQ